MTIIILQDSCQNLSLVQSGVNVNDTTSLVCQKDFFLENVGGNLQCKPSCSSWLMYSQSAETASLVIIGTASVVGILTTVVIVILAFVRFNNM